MLRRYYEFIVENRFPIVLTSPSKNACEVVNPQLDIVIVITSSKQKISRNFSATTKYEQYLHNHTNLEVFAL